MELSDEKYNLHAALYINYLLGKEDYVFGGVGLFVL